MCRVQGFGFLLLRFGFLGSTSSPFTSLEPGELTGGTTTLAFDLLLVRRIHIMSTTIAASS